MSIVTSKYVLLQNFLPEATNEELMTYALENESKFLQRSTLPDFPAQYGFGASKGFDHWRLKITDEVKKHLPEVLNVFELDFELGDFESDVSCFTDMGFLGCHNDTFCRNTRMISFVYYFNQQTFSGGQLALYDSEVDCFLRDRKARSCHLVEPKNNSCVFFPSRCWHEVLPVASDFASFPNNYFRGARFSINGWINKK